MKKLITSIIIPIVIGIGINISAFAQEKSSRELKGDKYAFRYAHAKAIDKYTHTKKLTLEGQRRLAESYRLVGLNTKSEETYSKFMSTSGSTLPEDNFNYAMVLKTNGKYDESNQWMDKFVALKPNDLRPKDYVAHKAEFTNISTDDGKYKTEHLTINTNAIDFGTSYYKNDIAFASNRATPKMIKRMDNWTGKPYFDLYVSKIEAGQLKDPKRLDKTLNGIMHDGPVSFNADGTYLAFTRNNYKDKSQDRVVELQIYFSNFKDGKWSKPEPFALNNQDYSVGHPCLSANGNTMYFTSDMPGGFGGSDIYKISKDENGQWKSAENMGNTVNTEGDELFPFFEESNETLFFSSTGRFGLGGLDIFICEINGSQIGRTYNAGAPLNTQADDFALILNETTNKGYISSNRTEGSGSDDIYSFDLLKELKTTKQIQGIAKDIDGKAIPTTFITLLDDKGNVLDTFTTKDIGAYSFLVDANKNFKLIGRKEKYMDGETLTNTSIMEAIVIADVTLLLKKEEIIARKIKPGADLAKILELNSIYFDLDKYDIRPDAETELDKIVDIMNKYPNMVVELGSYTDCRGSNKYNQLLSNKRAYNSADYVKERINNPERIYGKGYGEANSINGCNCEGKIVSTCTKAEFQENRRTEFIIIKQFQASNEEKK